MDQGKVRLLVLIACGLLPAADKPPALPLSEARWLAPGAPTNRLLRQPGECVAWPASPSLNDSARIGRIAFHAPLLLGGQAARAGLSCASCHRNGRDNPDFHFPGISGAAGTADVTASLLSSHRGDGKFNPKPIPDLADPSQRKISHDLRRDDLRKFVRGLIVEEFDGPEPPPAVLQGLLDYIRFMDPAECGKDVRITLGDTLGEVETALRLAEEEVAMSGDKETARFLVGAARSTLGRIDERFSVASLEKERSTLADAAIELGALQQSAARGWERALWRRWEASWPARKARLLAAEPRSLYSERVLRERMASRDWGAATARRIRAKLRGVRHNLRAGRGRCGQPRNTGCRGDRSKSRKRPRSATSRNSRSG